MNRSNWTSEQIEEYKRFHQKAKRRIANGESVISAYRDKPEGYSEWAEWYFGETGGIKLPVGEPIPAYECWYCHKIYTATRCPYCGKFKPRK